MYDTPEGLIGIYEVREWEEPGYRGSNSNRSYLYRGSNIDAIDVVRKIAGVAVIVVALALLGPKLLGFGTDLLGDAMNFPTAVHDAADAQPTSVVKQQVKLRMERLRDKQTIEDLGDGTILFLPEHQ